jgi:hypothetical protein
MKVLRKSQNFWSNKFGSPSTPTHQERERDQSNLADHIEYQKSSADTQNPNFTTLFSNDTCMGNLTEIVGSGHHD